MDETLSKKLEDSKAAYVYLLARLADATIAMRFQEECQRDKRDVGGPFWISHDNMAKGPCYPATCAYQVHDQAHLYIERITICT